MLFKIIIILLLLFNFICLINCTLPCCIQSRNSLSLQSSIVDPSCPFIVNSVGTFGFTLQVCNQGTKSTSGPITITTLDIQTGINTTILPPTTIITNHLVWNCTTNLAQVTCTSYFIIKPNQCLPSVQVSFNYSCNATENCFVSVPAIATSVAPESSSNIVTPSLNCTNTFSSNCSGNCSINSYFSPQYLLNISLSQSNLTMLSGMGVFSNSLSINTNAPVQCYLTNSSQQQVFMQFNYFNLVFNSVQQALLPTVTFCANNGMIGLDTASCFYDADSSMPIVTRDLLLICCTNADTTNGTSKVVSSSTQVILLVTGVNQFEAFIMSNFTCIQ